MIFALISGLKRIFCHQGIKYFAKIICYTENFYNFVLGNLVIQPLKYVVYDRSITFPGTVAYLQ